MKSIILFLEYRLVSSIRMSARPKIREPILKLEPLTLDIGPHTIEVICITRGRGSVPHIAKEADSWLLTPDSWVLIPDSWLLTPDSRFLTYNSWVLTPNSWVLTPDSWLSNPSFSPGCSIKFYCLCNRNGEMCHCAQLIDSHAVQTYKRMNVCMYLLIILIWSFCWRKVNA
jgi:hypothetical protein